MLIFLEPARSRTGVLLGHEHDGPDDAWPMLDEVVQIPMIGKGASTSLVAGSLVLYRLAGLV